MLEYEKRILYFYCTFLVFHIHAQLVYRDASNFPLLGRATESAGARYERFPDSLKNISRAPLWNLSRNSAGMAIRFRSNSTTIAAKWVALFNTHMNHMTDTGAKGLDLYCLQKNGDWRFVNSARPKGKTNQVTIIKICILKKGNTCFICHCMMVLFLCLSELILWLLLVSR